jgi:hypothetical protein
MPDQIVTVQHQEHANLDSFPFRYGFSQQKDFQLFLKFDSPITKTYKNRKKIDNAQFTNPNNGQEERGNFIISKNNDVITVIREDENVDETLSSAVKVFRKYRYVTVEELINYFHPLYIEEKIKTHEDFKKYWLKKNFADPKRIKEMEDTISNLLEELGEEKYRYKKLFKFFKHLRILFVTNTVLFLILISIFYISSINSYFAPVKIPFTNFMIAHDSIIVYDDVKN